MLTALQAQVEIGDCENSIVEYRQVSCHCLPSRLVTNVPNEDVAMHHQSLRGMTSAEAKKAFLNLIKSWPLHRATIFDVMVSVVDELKIHINYTLRIIIGQRFRYNLYAMSFVYKVLT